MAETNGAATTTTVVDDAPAEAASDDARRGVVDDGEPDLTGRLLSERYRVLECLGQGAMGAVYRAEHELMKKTLAIKVLRADFTDHGEAVERFRREAQAAANIDHPNVCQASDFGEMDDGAFFLVIEYLEGRTLGEVIDREGPLEPSRAVHIARQIASALGRAHEVGIVHRDLKPENIMLVERDGDPDFVKILDFGVARLEMEDDEARLTKAGMVYGTPSYMAPEQAAGGDVDPRTDLYALGVILFEMLAGRLPFDDANPARVMAAHVTEPAPSVASVTVAHAIDAELDGLVARLLAKAPEERPQSAAALIASLDAYRTEPAAPVSDGLNATLSALTRRLAPVERAVERARPKIDEALAWGRQQELWVQGALLGLVAAVIFGLAALPVVVWVAASSPADTEEARVAQQQSLAEARQAFVADHELTEATAALAAGDAQAALAALDAAAATAGDSAHVDYLRGQALAELGQWEPALAAYGQTLEAEPRYASDEALLDDVFNRYIHGGPNEQSAAERLIVERLDTPTANRRLADLVKFERHSLRKKAYGLLESTGRLDDLGEWNRLSVELRRSSNCDERKRLIKEIVDHGDPKGRAVLEHLAGQPRTGCGLLNFGDCHGCIRKALADALAQMPPAAPPTE